MSRKIKKRKSLRLLMMVLVVLLSVLPARVWAAGGYGGGSGTAEDPYLIYTPEQMNAIGADSNDWDKHFLVMADINLSDFYSAQFNIIGFYEDYSYGQGIPFTGVFDGNGYSIRNFTYNSVSNGATALFAYVSDPNAVIKNLTLVDPNIVGTGPHTACLVGLLGKGAVRDCKVINGRVRGIDFVGGLVGGSNALMSNCSFTGVVTGEDMIGGLIGGIKHDYYYDGERWEASACFSRGTVTGNRYVGGLIGGSEEHKYDGRCIISDCYSQCTVTGTSGVGGLCGAYAGYIYYCYAAGLVVGNSETGGLVSRGGYREISAQHSYWDVEITGQSNSATGDPRITAEMQDTRTFAGWGCFGTWTIDDGNDYPRLVWENAPGEMIIKPAYGGGSGTPNEPYLIYTADQFNTIGLVDCDLDKHFRLMGDIDLLDCSASQYNTIGSQLIPFSGVFDGNGYSISNLVLNSDQERTFGLFGFVKGAEAEIRNVHLMDVDINTSHGCDVGSLVGYFEGGTVMNCSVRGGLITGYYHVGGLIGSNAGFIVECHADCNVTSVDYACGVLVGSNRGRIWKSYAAGTASSADNAVGVLVGINGGDIYECFATGSASGDYSVGGLVGRNYHGTVVNCYAAGYAHGNRVVGGLLGYNDYAEATNSYSICSVTGSAGNIGGLVGLNGKYSKVTNCIWNIETSGKATSDGGIGLTTEEMLDVNSYLQIGWDFVGEFDNGPSDMWAENPVRGYPILWWQLDPLASLPEFSGGAGTSGAPYLIANSTDLSRIGHNPRLMSAHFKLTSNIDLTGNDFFIIGNRIHPFTGIFDGDHHQIFGFHCSPTNAENLGFFGYIKGKDAVVKNVGLVAPDVNAGTETSTAGCLAGYLQDGTIQDCYAHDANVSGYGSVAGLVAVSTGLITDSNSTASVKNASSHGRTGGLVAYNNGHVYSSHSVASVSGGESVGGLVGKNDRYGEVWNSYSLATVIGDLCCGGLIGWNYDGSVGNCYSVSNVFGNYAVGGLIGRNYYDAKLTNSFAEASVKGTKFHIGGLVGDNDGDISNCYVHGDVEGQRNVGGLAGTSAGGDVSNCYSTAAVLGTGEDIGGLVGHGGEILASFWNTETSGQSTSAGGTGLVTTPMQKRSTFEDAGWDFVGESLNGTEDIWVICEGLDYPMLRSHFRPPVLMSESEITLGTSNVISWEAASDAGAYCVECAEDANFAVIFAVSGWVAQAAYEFVGLNTGQDYWYRVRARIGCDFETDWSNPESSLQLHLNDAVDVLLDPNSLKGSNMKNTLLKKIDVVLSMIEAGKYKSALAKLEHDILKKTDGCVKNGEPDNNDWIQSCEAQGQIYPYIEETIEYVRILME